MKFSNIAQNNTPANTDFLLGVTAGGTDYRTLITNITKILYPVGSLYFNASDGTNPGTLLGFGTWTAYAKGQVPVGFNASDTDFATIGATGGEKAHTLTVNEMAWHQHTGNTAGNGNHSHSSTNHQQTAIQVGSSTNTLTTNGNAAKITWGDTTTSTDGYHGHSFTTDAAGGSAPHNVMQPYVVVYVWQRTA